MSPALRGLPVAYVDVETTGLDPSTGYVVEIAVVHALLGETQPVVAWSQRIRPPIDIPEEATEVHGISDEDVADCPTWAKVAGEFARHTEGHHLVAYNAPFDFGFIRAEQKRAGLAAPVWPWLDPSIIVKRVDQFERGKRQADAARRRGIRLEAHGATGDALTTAILFPMLLRELGRHPKRPRPSAALASVDAYLRWQGATACEQERDLARFLGAAHRPDYPWHALEGIDAPSWEEPPTPTVPCPECREPVVYLITQAGTVQVVNADDVTHVCGGAQ